MNGYVCVKACNLGGVVYNKGDAISFDAVLSSREKTLIGQGFIARVESLESLITENQHLKARIADMEETQINQAQPEVKQESGDIETIQTIETNAEVSKNKSRKR